MQEPPRQGRPVQWTPSIHKKKKRPLTIHQHQQKQSQDAYRAAHLAYHQPSRPSSERMRQDELYQYYKRQGLLDVYFALFPNG